MSDRANKVSQSDIDISKLATRRQFFTAR